MPGYRLRTAHLDVFSRTFRALADRDGAILIHCAAGKDRTGLLVALIHHTLGVSRHDIMEDYLLTNAARRTEDWVTRFSDLLEREYGRRPLREAVQAFLQVHPAWLESALSAIEANTGGLDAYVEEALGVDATLRRRIHENLHG
jgi:protein tyrosine/serine phosphatase